MSHNLLKVENQTPNINGEIDLNVSNIGSFTSATNKFLGVDASSNLVQLDSPSASDGSLSWTPVYHYFGRPQGWGGSAALTTNTYLQYLPARHSSGTVYSDTNFVTPKWNGSPNAVWTNQFTLIAGTYLFNACFMGRINTVSDQCIISLKNITDDTRHGNKGYWGAQQYSNNMYAYLTIGTTKTFGWSIETITGSPISRNSIGILSTHLNIWRL